MTLIEEAASLMLHQFTQSYRLHSLLKGLITPFQESLNITENLDHGHYIDDACGPSLDIIGDIVGQKRQGMSDDDFKAWIKVRILLNKNTGTPEQIFAILGILFGAKPKVSMDELPPNTVIFTLYEQPHCPTKVLFSIIRSALPLGITCKFMRADQPSPSLAVTSLKKISRDKALRFDITPFSESYFADFYEEDNYDRNN